jgi:hypothetical protein
VLQSFAPHFSWLTIVNPDRDEAKEHARGCCTACQQHSKNNQWGKPAGATIFSKNSCEQHASTGGHKKAMEAVGLKAGLDKGRTSAVDKAWRAAAGVAPLFLTMLAWMMVQNTPLSHFSAVLVLLTALGLTDVEGMFNNSRYVWRALFSLSEAIMAGLLVELTGSPCFTIMFDLSSDIGREEHMLLYVKYMRPDKLEVVTRYLCCVRVLGKTGECLADTILLIMQKLGLNCDKLVGVCTDGEAAMTGCRRGAVVVLQRSCTKLAMTMHCLAHQTNLVMVNAEKHHAVLKRLDTVLSKTAALFHCKTGKYRLWQKYCAVYKVTQCAWNKFNITRWFSRAQCSFQLLARLHLLLSFLSAFDAPGQPLHWADGVELRDMLLCTDVVFTLVCLCDLIAPLERLRKGLESSSGRLSQIPGLKKDCVDTITKQFIEPLSSLSPCTLIMPTGFGGSRLKGFLDHFDAEENVWAAGDHMIKLRGSLYPDSPALDDDPLYDLLSAMKLLAEDIVQGLNNRFDSQSMQMCTHFSIFELTAFVGMLEARLQQYGNAEFNLLCQQFGTGPNKLFDITDAQLKRALGHSWLAVKRGLHKFVNTDGQGASNFKAAWLSAFADATASGRVVCAEFKLLFYSYCLMSSATAEVERGFSTHADVKNANTNSLHVATVDARMRCDEYFAFTAAAAGVNKARQERQAAAAAAAASVAATAAADNSSDSSSGSIKRNKGLGLLDRLAGFKLFAASSDSEQLLKSATTVFLSEEGANNAAGPSAPVVGQQYSNVRILQQTTSNMVDSVWDMLEFSTLVGWGEEEEGEIEGEGDEGLLYEDDAAWTRLQRLDEAAPPTEQQPVRRSQRVAAAAGVRQLTAMEQAAEDDEDVGFMT